MTLPSISRALKTARGAVFAPRDADAGPGLFDSRTPLLLTMYNKKKEKSSTSCEVELFGDPYGNRTHVTAVKGPCLNRLTNGP